MPRPPFNAEAPTKEELEASRSPEFAALDERALKGGSKREAAALGVQPLTIEEQKTIAEYLALHRKLGNLHVEGYDDLAY
jgi:hypothetical protein